MERMRTMLFCPADRPKLYISGPAFRPDCIIFDLEDAVPRGEKDAARDLLAEAAAALDFCGCAVYARINAVGTEFCADDIRTVVRAGIRNVRLAMCESGGDVLAADQMLSEAERGCGIPVGSVKIQCSIETPKGVLSVRDILRQGGRITSLSFGAEDYTRCMGVSRSKSAAELDFARSFLPVAAAEAGIPAVDTVWTDLADMEGFEAEVRRAKELGFAGKSCIHPSQIAVVHRIFAPAQEELEYARRVMNAFAEASEAGTGVFTVDGKMVDEPVIQKARRILARGGDGGELHGLY